MQEGDSSVPAVLARRSKWQTVSAADCIVRLAAEEAIQQPALSST
jgi:hypothetical protein